MRKSDLYTIDEEVGHNGSLYQYMIRSSFGDFPAHGDSLLHTRLLEISSLDQLKNDSQVGVVVDSAVSSLVDMGKSPFDAATHLASHPVDSIVGMPGGVADRGRHIVYLAMDHVAWTEDVAHAFASLLKVGRESGGDMFFSGTLSAKARGALNKAGWKTHESVRFPFMVD